MLSLVQVKQYGDDIAEDIQRIGQFGECVYDDLGRRDNFSRVHRWGMLGEHGSVQLFFFFWIFETGSRLILSCQTGILSPVFCTVYDDAKFLEYNTRTHDVAEKMLVGLHDGLVIYLENSEEAT
jgi:hypothetical protein